jgi:molecular chaperone DnaK
LTEPKQPPRTSGTFGIDLGTTYSVVGYIDEMGRAAVARNSEGSDTTPSVVYFESETNVVVGSTAKAAAGENPDRVVSLIKREMGDREYRRTFFGVEYTPPSISAIILGALARQAEEDTGRELTDVVITVPAYFGLLERDATRKAGEIAGLNVIGIIPEPVAAAMHYGVTGSADGTCFLLYDLGGGTFDVSLIRMTQTSIEVLVVGGDHRLGGADWDARLLEHLVEQAVAQSGDDSLRDDEPMLQELRLRAEEMKKALSSAESKTQMVRYTDTSAKITVTRAQFEEMTADLLDETIRITRRTLAHAEVRYPGITGQISEVLLVGGSSKMPAVGAALTREFGWALKLTDPDLAVAKGAALYAAGQTVRYVDAEGSGQGTGSGSLAAPGEVTDEAVQKVADQLGLTDEQVRRLARRSVASVLPRAIGIRLFDASAPNRPEAGDEVSYIQHLFHASDRLPAAGHFSVATLEEGQERVEIAIYEQAGASESSRLEDNRQVLKGTIRGIPSLPGGATIDITMNVNEEGLLSVTAVEPVSGMTLEVEVRVGVLGEELVTEAKRTYSGLTVSAGESLDPGTRTGPAPARPAGPADWEIAESADITGTGERLPPGLGVDDSTPRHAEGSTVDASLKGERVECSVFAPSAASPGSTFLVQAFAHLSSQTGKAKLMAKEFDRDSVRRAIKTLESSVLRGTRLNFSLCMPGLLVDNPVQSMVWLGRAESVQFGVSVPTRHRFGNVVGTILVSQDWIPIGHIKFTLEVAARPTVNQERPSLPLSAVGQAAKRYQIAFISYASEDRTTVLERVQVLPTIGVRTFQDVLDLEPGERWERSLYQHIDQSDIVLLFWSSAAKRSTWVRKEVQYALARKHGDEFAPPEIGPVIIEGPPVPRPWKELAHLHFNDRRIYLLDR